MVNQSRYCNKHNKDYSASINLRFGHQEKTYQLQYQYYPNKNMLIYQNNGSKRL